MKNLKSIIKNQKSKILKFRRARRRLLNILIVMLVIIGSYQIWAYINPDSAGAWWDDGWLYRKKITFSNSGDSQGSKIVTFQQDTATLISEGKLQAGCNDIRFVDSVGRVLEHRTQSGNTIQFVPGSASEYSSRTNQSGYTFSHTVAAGQNQVLVVIVHAMNEQTGSNPINVNSVTFDGVSMTKQVEVDLNHPTTTNRDYVTAIFTLVNPSVTTANIAVALNGTTSEHVASAMNFIGVDQTTPVGVTASNTGTSLSDVAVTGNTLYDNSVLVGGGSRQSIDSGPVRLVYTQLPGKHVYTASTGGGTSRLGGGGGFQYAESPGSQTMTFGLSNATSNTHMTGAFIELKPNGCNSVTTDIEVLIPSINSGENHVYMYYNNPSAPDTTSTLSGSANVTYKEHSTGSVGADFGVGSTLNYPHTVTAGENQVLVVIVKQIKQQSGDVPVDVSSVTYNSRSLVRQVFADGTSTNRNGSTEIWTLLNPDTGNNQVTITFAETGNTVIVSGAMTFENVRQNYFPVAGAKFQGQSSPFEVDITTTKPNTLLVGSAGRHRSTTAPNATTANVELNSPGTEVYDRNQANPAVASSISSSGGYQPAASAGSHSVNFTSSTPSNTFWTGALIALEPESYGKFSPTSGPTDEREEENDRVGPVAYWKMDEGADNTCVGGYDICDSTSRRMDGEFYASASRRPESECVFGKCLLFDGSNSRANVDINDYIDFDVGLKEAVSVSFWVNPSSDGEDDAGRIFSKGGGEKFYCRTENETGGMVDLRCTLDLATTDPNVVIPGGLTIGQWHHVEVTYANDGNDDLLIYIDGELKATGDGSGSPASGDNDNFLIGGNSARNFHGYIDDFKIFAYERTAEEVKTDYLIGASAAGSNIAVGIGGTAMPDPIAWWRLDEMNGSTANDNTSSGFSGTITSATWTQEGKYSNALSFDGTDDYVNMGDVDALDFGASQDFTVSAWVKTNIDPVTDFYPTVITKGGGSPRNGFSISANAAQFSSNWRGSIDVNGTQYACDSGRDITDNQWHHLVLQRSGSNLLVYTDGVLSNTCAASASTIANTNDLRFGRSNYGSPWDYWFQGLIDDVKIYDVALTADQVKTDYNATSAFNAGTGVNERTLHASGDSYLSSLYAHWSFDENITQESGNIVSFDLSGNGRHGRKSLDPLSNIRWIPGVHGSAADFNNSWYITIWDETLFNPGLSDFTYMAWLYLDSRTSAGRHVFNKMTGSGYGYVTSWNPTNHTLNTGLRNNFAVLASQNSVDISSYENHWHHYALVFDRDGMVSTFIDGQIVDADSIASASLIDITNDNTFTMGAQAGDPMYAKVDEFKFFMSALTPAQIAYEYNRGAPLAWYRMDECQGTTINDASGNEFTGTLNVGGSGTYTSAGTCGSGTGTHAWNAGTVGKFERALAFDGTDDYIDFGDVSTFDFGANQDFTVATWVKTNINPVTDTYPFILNKDGGSPRSGFSIVANVAQFSPIWRGAIWVSGTQYFCSGATDITDNQWHHLVLQRSGSNLSVYEDGNLANTCAASDSSITNTANFAIGSYSNLSTGWFNGLVDDVRIYNYALSPEQVKSVMNGGTVRFE